MKGERHAVRNEEGTQEGHEEAQADEGVLMESEGMTSGKGCAHDR